jgi:signal transduction histidine kinase/ActR/RegA family two-component response regulator
VRLAAERNLHALPGLILSGARAVTWSDAGCLYLVEPDGAGTRRLRFKLAQGDAEPLAAAAHVLPIGPESVAGYAALSGTVLSLPDLERPAPGLPFTVDRTIDRETGYRTRSMLAVPMRTPRGEVVGVLQLLNRRPSRDRRFASAEEAARAAAPFSGRSQDLALALAAQGAVALDNGRLHAELRAAVAVLGESQQRIIQTERLRALGDMAGGVAHGFNNVLAVIVGRAQLLLRQVEDMDLRRQLEIIEQVAQDGARTVRRIQEFARMRRTRPFQRVDLSELAREAVDAARPRWGEEAQARGRAYDVRLELGSVPPVVGDPGELRESLLNVFVNALDAMPHGGRLTVSTRVERDQVVCAIEDEGTGMTEEVRQRCFEPFFTTKAEHGTGLGLSIAYGIVTRHGGDIDAWSRPGEGSRFVVRLPAVEDSTGRAARAAPAPGRPARILVAEDEPAVRGVLVDLLAARGHEVVACGDGAAALERLEDGRFDLALLDLSMPGLSGWDVAERARRSHPDLPIALITGWGDDIDAAEAGVRGIDHVVAKPFDLDDIGTLVERALARRTRPPEGQPGGTR